MKTITELKEEIEEAEAKHEKENMPHTHVRIMVLEEILTQTKAIVEMILNSHFLRPYEIFRGSSRISEKEIKQKLLQKIKGGEE